MRIGLIVSFLVFGILGACARDESIASFADNSADYHLAFLDGAAFSARATIAFPEPGRVIGQAPCNSYFAAQTVPYPWFGIEGVGSTRMACDDLADETVFLSALQDMTLAEVSGTMLILTNTAGREMVFVAQ